ncbi:MAG TPA: phosphate regulon sensor histidine kinase PhoR [Burkholderiaceae bacterium]|nr:phosphate regulon sensor histidine kinase PhoR [Burkholderiaceae bacterium]
MLTEFLALAFFACLALLLVSQWWRNREKRLIQRHTSEIKALNGRLSQSFVQLQAFLDAIQASPNGVIFLDGQRRIKWCNVAAANLLGLNSQRDIDQHIVHLVRNPKFQQYIAEQNFTSELFFEDKALQLYPYGNADKNNSKNALILIRDVSAIAKAETMRRDFVANVSHEIRTPLTVINGYIETLQSLSLSHDEQQKYLHTMAAQGQRLDAIVTDLLTLSKLDDPVQPMHEMVDLHPLLMQCKNDAQALAITIKKDINFNFDIEYDAKIRGSKTELLSAISNLINNAVRYSYKSGSISVIWNKFVLSVKDTGCGIAKEDIPRLTERFYRADKSRTREQLDESASNGSGLGLAIVKHVALRHGATLEIESTLGSGSTFKLHFQESTQH